MNRPQTIREQVDRLFALFRHAGRFYKMGLLLSAVGVLISVGVALTRARIYKSEALILYRERIAPTALGRDEAGESARRLGMRLRELVLSRSRLEQVIGRFKLYPQVVDTQGMAEAVDQMRTKVGFKAREGDTYALSFEGEDPQLVQGVTQMLTDELVNENRRRSEELATGTKEFLEGESQRIEDELRKREQALAQFLSDHPAFAAEAARSGAPAIVSMSAGKGGVAQKRRTSSSDPRIDALEREAERIQARLNPSPPPVPSVAPEYKEAAEEWSRRKAEATRELEAAQRDLNDKRQSFTDEHPDVKRAKARAEGALRNLDEVQLKGMREMARLQGKTPPPLQPLTPEEKDKLRADLSRIQGELGRARAALRQADKDKADKAEPDKVVLSEGDTIVQLETSYAQLTREVNEAREQRNQLEERRFTANLRASVMQNEGSARMVVIDPPYKPTRPVRGGRAQTLAMGGVVAVALAMLLMVVRALVDDRVYDRFDVERLGIGPLLTSVPSLPARGAAPGGPVANKEKKKPDRQVAVG